MSSIQLHFDGEFASNHQISMRTLGKSLTSLQSALDRAYLDNKSGYVVKHARLTSSDYLKVQFLVQPPQEGGYILKFLSNSDIGKKIVDRVTSAISKPFELAMKEGEVAVSENAEKFKELKSKISKGLITPTDYEGLISAPDQQIVKRYGDRSIVKEIDQMVAPVRSDWAGKSTLELTMDGEKTVTFTFNRAVSQKFHEIVSKRTLGQPLIYRARVVSLNNKNLNGKIYNVVSKKEANIYFHSEEDFKKACPFLEEKESEMQFIGFPVIEYGTFDLYAGDVYFSDLLG